MKKLSSKFALPGAIIATVSALFASDGGRPLYGQFGLQTTSIDHTIAPGDDFFAYANGRWLASHRIQADKTGASLRLDMSDRIEARLHELMESAAAADGQAPADLAGKVGAFYKAFMDEAHIESLGAGPLAPELDAVRAAPSRDALADLMGRTNVDFFPSLFGCYVYVDLKNPTKYALYLTQGGLGLPDRDYYLKPAFAVAKQKYEAYIAQLLTLVGWADASARARDVVEFETGIAEASWTKTQERDLDATYNPVDASTLGGFAPGLAWPRFLASAGLTQQPQVIVAEKSAFPRLTALYANTPLETLRAWMVFHVADNAAPYLAAAFTNAYFELHGKTLSGQSEQQVRWKRGVLAVAGGDFLVGDRFGTFGTLGFGVGQLYAAKYFGPDAKAKIEALVHTLVAAYRARLEHLDWMSPASRQEAIKKLDTYTIKVGYPDHPRDYAGVVITDDNLVDDVRRAAAADWSVYSGRINHPVDKSDWGMTPQTNDAYNGDLRDIVFPAGILQAPIFDPNADPAINYGAIGGVIGHELTHGFDDQGRKIDAAGALRDWWTKDDAEKFESRARRLGAQYSQFAPLPGVQVNGDLTMGENIADLGGLTLAFDAYQASLHGQPAPVIDGLTGNQRLFLGWAQAWCGKVKDEFVKKQVVSDPHSPRQFRVNGVVRNIDAWYATFAVKPADQLYLAPADRVRIW